MGTTPAKKSPAKNGRAPAQQRQSASKNLKQEDAPSSGPTTRSSVRTPTRKESPRETSYSHKLPTDEQRRANGRHGGRRLVMWNRPRMAEKLLLHIHYECWRHKINVPWGSIAHRLKPGSSGAAVCQHFNKLRKELLAEGHVVPPMPNKPEVGFKVDPEIRGYIRKYPDGDDKVTSEPVRYDEEYDDPRFNLPDTFGNLFEGENMEEDEQMSAEEIERLDQGPETPETPTPVRYHPVASGMEQQPNVSPYAAWETPLELEEFRAMQANQAPANIAGFQHNDRPWVPDSYNYSPYHAASGPMIPPTHFTSPSDAQHMKNMPGQYFPYGRPEFMPIPVGIPPSYFPYHNPEAAGQHPAMQHSERVVDLDQPLESPAVSAKVETPNSEPIESIETPIDDLLVPGVCDEMGPGTGPASSF